MCGGGLGFNKGALDARKLLCQLLKAFAYRREVLATPHARTEATASSAKGRRCRRLLAVAASRREEEGLGFRL